MDAKIQELRKVIINKTGENYGKYLLSDVVLSYFDIFKDINDGEILNNSEIKNIRNFYLDEILDKAFKAKREDGLYNVNLELFLMNNDYLKLRSIYQKYKVELSIILDAYKTKFTSMEDDKLDDIEDLTVIIEEYLRSMAHNLSLSRDSIDYIYFLLPKRYTKAKFQNQLELIFNLMSLSDLDYSRVLDMVVNDCKPLFRIEEDEKIISVENFIEELKFGLNEKEISFEVKRMEEKGYILYDAIDKVILTLEAYDRILYSLNAYLLIYGKEKIDYYKYIDMIDDLGPEELDEISYEHYNFFEKVIEDKELAFKDEEIRNIILEMIKNHKDYDSFSKDIFVDSKSLGIEVNSGSELASKISDLVIDKAENKSLRRMRMNLALCELPRQSYNVTEFLEEVRFFLENASLSEYANFRSEFLEMYEKSAD